MPEREIDGHVSLKSPPLSGDTPSSAVATTLYVATAVNAAIGILNQSDTSLVASINANSLAISNEVTARKQAISDLVGGAPELLDTLKEIANALGDDTNLSVTLKNSINSISVAVVNETSRALVAEASLSSYVANVSGALEDETSRAMAAEDSLEDSLSSNIANVSGAVVTETFRAMAAEASLSSNIANVSGAVVTETFRAMAAEASLSSNVANVSGAVVTETFRAMAAEASLSSNVANVSGAVVNENSRALVAEASLSSYVANVSGAVVNENSRALAAEIVLTSSVSTVSAAVVSEKSRAEAAEGVLTSSKASLSGANFTGAVSAPYIKYSNAISISGDTNVTYTAAQIKSGFIDRTPSGDSTDIFAPAELTSWLNTSGDNFSLTINNNSAYIITLNKTGSVSFSGETPVLRSWTSGTFLISCTGSGSWAIYSTGERQLKNMLEGYQELPFPSGGNTSVNLSYLQDKKLVIDGDSDNYYSFQVTSDITLANGDFQHVFARTSESKINISASTLNTTLDSYFNKLPNAIFNKIVINSSLEANASQINNKNISGNGSVKIYALDSTPEVDLSGIVSNGTVTMYLTKNTTLTSAAILPGVASILDGAYKLIVNNANTISHAVTVPSGATLEGSAAFLSGKTINGAGSVIITDVDANTNLANISVGVKSVKFIEDVTYSVNLSGWSVEVASGKTLTVSAANISGVRVSGLGSVNVTAMAADTNLANISVSGTKTAQFAASVTYGASLSGWAVTVASGNTLTISAAYISGVSVSGVGSVTVSDAILSGQAFGGLPSSGTVFNAGGVADTAMPPTFVTNAGLSITAAVANGKTITGSGVVTVSEAISSAQAFGGLPNATVFSLGGVNTASMPSSFVTNAALSISAAVASGKTVTGLGPIVLTSVIAEGQTFDGLTCSGSITFVGGVNPASMPATFVNNAGLSIAASVLSGKTVTGLGPIVLTSAIEEGQRFAGLTGSGQYYSITFVGGVNPASMPATFVNNAGLSIAASVLSDKTVTGLGPIVLTSVIAEGQRFAGLTGSGQYYSITFVGGVNPASMPATFVNNDTLRIAASVLSGKTVTGLGPIVLTSEVAQGQRFAGLTGSGQHYSITFVGGVNPASMPSSFVTNSALSIKAAVANGKTITVTDLGVVTVSDAILLEQAFGGLPNATVFSLGGVASENEMPSSFVTNAALSITAAVADGKTITGLGVVTVSDAISSAQAFSGLPNATVFSLGGVNPASMPSSFVTNAALSISAAVASGKTITGLGVITVSDAILSTQAFDGLPNATVFSGGVASATTMPSSFVTNAALSIKAAVASSKTITVTGLGRVTVSDAILSGQAFSGLPNATVFSLGGVADTAMPSSFVTNSALYIKAAVANGKTITVTGLGVVNVSDAILLEQAFGGLPNATVFSLGGVASENEMPSSFVTNAALSITAAVADGKTITGLGVVTVSDAISSAQAFDGLPSGTIFSLGGVADVTMPSSFVTNADLNITAAAANGKTITGSGVVTVSDAISSAQAFGGLPSSGTVFNAGGVASATAMPPAFVTNAALSITAAIASSKTITGSGVVTVSDAISSSQNFSGLPNATVFSGGVASATAMPSSFVTNAALSIKAAVANGKTITGSGVITVSDAILSTQAFGGLPNATVFSLGGVASATAMPSSFVTNETLSITAAVATGKTITGLGVVNVTALNATPAAVLSGITATGVVTVLMGANTTLTTAARFPAFGSNLDGAYKLTIASAANFSQVTVRSGATIEGDAAYLTGLTINGAGNVTVNAMAAATVLSNITASGTKTANFSTGLQYSASLYGWNVTIASATSLNINADYISGVSVSGNGAIIIQNVNANTDLSKITLSGSKNAIFDSNVTYGASLLLWNFEVNSGKTLTIDAAYISGANASNTGSIIVNNMGAATDLSRIGLGGTKTAKFSSNITYSASLSGWVVEVASTKTLTITAAYISGVNVTGDGAVTVSTAILSTQNFSGFPSNTVFAFGGVASATAMPSSFVTNAALSITAAVANGKTITGSGVVTVSDGIFSGQAFGGLPSGTIFSEGGVLPASMPSSFVTAGLTIFAAVASGKTITGSGVITVADAILATQAFGGLPSGTIFQAGGVASTTAMPSSFVTNEALSIKAAIASGKTITGLGVITVSDAILSAQAFSGLPSGTVFSGGVASATEMPSSFVTNAALSITAAVADGKTITGSGVVTVNNKITGTQNFSGLPNGTEFTGGSGSASISFNGNFPPASFIFGGTVSYYVTVASVVGKGITGAGNILITNWAGVNTGDFSNIDVNNLTYLIDSNVSAFSGKLKNNSDTINLSVKLSITFSIAHDNIIEVSRYGDSGLPAVIVTKIGSGTLTLLYLDGTRVVSDASTNNPYFTDTRLSTLLSLPSTTEYRLTKSNGTIQINTVV